MSEVSIYVGLIETLKDLKAEHIRQSMGTTYKAISHVRNLHPEGPCSRTMPSLLWRS